MFLPFSFFQLFDRKGAFLFRLSVNTLRQSESFTSERRHPCRHESWFLNCNPVPGTIHLT
jgi:hypothetical protein